MKGGTIILETDCKEEERKKKVWEKHHKKSVSLHFSADANLLSNYYV